MSNFKKALLISSKYLKISNFILLSPITSIILLQEGGTERTRQFIIEQVAPVFNKKGYSGTSLSDLTEATKLTKGAIYGHFKNKDEIAIEAFKYNVSTLGVELNSELALIEQKSAIVKLHTIVKVFINGYPKIMSIGGCPILNTSTDTDDTHPILRELSKASLLGLKNLIGSIIVNGIENNNIKNSTDADATAGLIITLFEGGVLLAKTMSDDNYFYNAMTHISDIIKRLEL